VLPLPHALRFLLATNPAALTQVRGVVYLTTPRYLIGKAGPMPGFRFVGQAEEEGDLPQLDLDPARL
jgi:hypothetical protein